VRGFPCGKTLSLLLAFAAQEFGVEGKVYIRVCDRMTDVQEINEDKKAQRNFELPTKNSTYESIEGFVKAIE
jgi:hypothetical protein